MRETPVLSKDFPHFFNYLSRLEDQRIGTSDDFKSRAASLNHQMGNF